MNPFVQFMFRPEIMMGIAQGTLKIVDTNAGNPIGMVRDVTTGRFIAHAVGIGLDYGLFPSPFNTLVKGGLTTAQIMESDSQETDKNLDVLNAGIHTANMGIQALQENGNFLKILSPMTIITQLATSGVQIAQTHLGFQKTYQELDVVKFGLDTILSSVDVLQASTALIGVGTVAGVALGAVNLHQMLKLREDVRQMRLEVKEGFLDLKQALQDQGAEVIQRIDQVAEDIKFEQHRVILVEAYGKFLEGIRLTRTAQLCQNPKTRHQDLQIAKHILSEAVAAYKNPRLLGEVSAPGYLRRVECAWAIEQALIMIFQLQNEWSVVSDRVIELQQKMRQDCLDVLDRCESEDELDFLYPELMRINFHDITALEIWQNQAEWLQSLSEDDQEQLTELELPKMKPEVPSETFTTLGEHPQTVVLAKPMEQIFYEVLKPQSHYSGLRDQLRFMIKPSLRHPHESYICEQAKALGDESLVPGNWQEVPDIGVANLYYFFKTKEALR